MALLYYHMSQLNICTLFDQRCSIVIFITQAAPNCYNCYQVSNNIILVITLPTDELHWMTVSGVVTLVVLPMNEML